MKLVDEDIRFVAALIGNQRIDGRDPIPKQSEFAQVLHSGDASAIVQFVNSLRPLSGQEPEYRDLVDRLTKLNARLLDVTPSATEFDRMYGSGWRDLVVDAFYREIATSTSVGAHIEKCLQMGSALEVTMTHVERARPRSALRLVFTVGRDGKIRRQSQGLA